MTCSPWIELVGRLPIYAEQRSTGAGNVEAGWLRNERYVRLSVVLNTFVREPMTVFPDKAALDYDLRIEKLVPGYALALQLFGSVLSGRIADDGVILVPGCGTGSEILALARCFPEARFTAVEPSSGMLATARVRLSAPEILSRVTFVEGFLQDTPTQLFSAATVSLVLHFLPDDGSKAGFLTAIAERLQPGAPLLLFDAPERADDAVLRCWLEQQGHSAALSDAICHRMQTEWHRITPERLDALLLQTGFTAGDVFVQMPGFIGVVATRQSDDNKIAPRSAQPVDLEA